MEEQNGVIVSADAACLYTIPYRSAVVPVCRLNLNFPSGR